MILSSYDNISNIHTNRDAVAASTASLHDNAAGLLWHMLFMESCVCDTQLYTCAHVRDHGHGVKEEDCRLSPLAA